MRRQTNRRFLRQGTKLSLGRGRRPYGKQPLALEPLEQRTLLTAGLFLQGTAFFDVNTNHVLDVGDVYKGSSPQVPAAKIQLYDAAGVNLLAETTTDANGAYRFDDSTMGVNNAPINLTPGTYRIVEVPPSGFVNEDVQILSQLYSATAIGLNTIEVTLVDPSNLYVHYDARGPGRTDEVDNTGSGFAGQLKIHVDQNPGPSSPSASSPQFLTVCTDITSTVVVGDIFRVILEPSDASAADLGVNAGRIAYLYNHYGTTPQTNDNATAIQVAIWELVYDAVPDLSSGNFQLIGPASIVPQANAYLSESAGKNEVCTVLDAFPPGQTELTGRQDMLAAESYNFANVPGPPAIQIIKYVNGDDADTAPGVHVPVGSTLTFTYDVTAVGSNVPIKNVVVSDDNAGGTPFNPAPVLSGAFNVGDTNTDGLLEAGETWKYQDATHVALVGQHTNIGTVTGQDNFTNEPVSDTNPANYFGDTPAIQIVKYVNGNDADSAPGVLVPVGSTLTFTYDVTAVGSNVPIKNVVVSDDNAGGTPFNPAPLLSGAFNVGDTNTDGLLEAGETWKYQNATHVALVGQHTNIGTVTGQDNFTDEPVSDTNPANYFGQVPICVIGPDKSPSVPQEVKVIDESTGNVLSQFVPYESDFVGGVRIATGDMNGDGIDEIITAPGRGRAPEIRVFTQDGTELTAYRTMAYDTNFIGGVQVAVGDVNGDGKPDIVTIPTFGPAEVKVFLNQSPNADPIQDNPYRTFLAFSSKYISGGVVAVADMGELVAGSFVNTLDGNAEIIVGSGAGMPSSVRVFDVAGTPTLAEAFVPFSSTFEGGLSLSVAKIDADPIPDIVVGAGTNGDSNVDVWAWNTGAATLVRLGGFTAFSGVNDNAAVRVAAQDTNGDGTADTILAVQGTDGTSGQIRIFTITNTSPFQVLQETPLSGFPGPWFIAPLSGNAVPSGAQTDSSNGSTGTSPVPQGGIATVNEAESSASTASTIGLYDPAANHFYLRNSNSVGTPDEDFLYGSDGGWLAITGDWDGDGVDTVGLYDPVESVFYLRNTNDAGEYNEVFAYGPANGGWLPIAGDWNGDGIDTVGVFNPALSRFYLRNTNTPGYADVTFAYGAPDSGWKPLVGDWNGDGVDTAGVYDPAISRFYARNTNTPGYADVTFAYGAPASGWMPLVGDWNGDGVDTAGVYDPAVSRFYLRNTNTPGVANVTFAFGPAGSGWTPMVGDWNGNVPPLLAADGPAISAADDAGLTTSQLQPLLTEAIARWTAAGLSDSAVAMLNGLNVQIANLPGSRLGEASGNTIYIDRNAAGYGWFVDPTPALDEEFALLSSDQQLRAVDPRAVDRIDLLSVVEHELGHIIGLTDADVLTDDVMSGVLGVGVRRNP